MESMLDRACKDSALQILGSASAIQTSGFESMPTIVTEFAQHQASVRKLVNFDRDISDFVVGTLKDQVERLKASGVTNPDQTGEKLLRVLEPIRTNNSLRSRYETVFNQAVVLLVSHFGSTIHTLFTNTIREVLERGGQDSQIAKEELSFSVSELCDPSFEVRDAIPEALALASDVSWQDMQSIHRTFKKYFRVEMQRDELVNDIIAAQAARHCIVHSGAVVDERMLKQLANAKPRKIKVELRARQALQFSPEEIELVSTQMATYLKRLEEATRSALSA